MRSNRTRRPNRQRRLIGEDEKRRRTSPGQASSRQVVPFDRGLYCRKGRGHRCKRRSVTASEAKQSSAL
jgi:hypothetical protein